MVKSKRKSPIKDIQKEKRALKRKIKATFTGVGFEHIPTNGHEMKVGTRTVEVDAMFVYKNIWLLCEDTVQNNNKTDHILRKNEAAREIKSHIGEFIEELIKIFPEKKDILKEYNKDRIKLYFLYTNSSGIEETEDIKTRFSNLTFMQLRTLNYFNSMMKCVKYSARNEIFRFLGLKSNQIGIQKSTSEDSKITAPIVYSNEMTGLANDIRVVSFMMSAQDLLDTCYVLRKDNWEESIWLYQRLIVKNKIRNIRKFLENSGEAFYNNIIVALPDKIKFEDKNGNYKSINNVSDLGENLKLILPKEINSICVIDGQHRIFAHYESGTDDQQEKKIKKLRKRLHLLVTGLVFPEDMPEEKKRRFQSRLFLEINSNTKKVPASVLLQIRRIQNPIADESIAQSVIEHLNRKGVFKDKFQLSTLGGGTIKTASIVRFALRYLVTAKPEVGKKSLYEYWNGDKKKFDKMEDKAVDNYTEYCSVVLEQYFSAIKEQLQEYWNEESKLLSVISINGFIIAFTRQLSVNGVKDRAFYSNIFKNWEIDFSKDKFPYTSSQYRKFSTKILKEAFKIDQAI